VCDADEEFGVSVAIGNGHIYDLVGCGGNADLRPTEAPAAGERRPVSTVYCVHRVRRRRRTGRTRAPCRPY
jgi:hypothetical protein